jgi:hypothetical protein
MSVTAHFETLNQKHARLETAIENAYASHLPDTAIRALKKQKLHLKEELYLLTQKMGENELMKEAA